MSDEKKKYKSFKEYYQDEEFKQKHLQRISEKIKCPMCDCMIQRYAMCKHQKTKKCQMIASTKPQANEIKVKIQQKQDIKNKIKALENELKTINI